MGSQRWVKMDNAERAADLLDALCRKHHGLAFALTGAWLTDLSPEMPWTVARAQLEARDLVRHIRKALAAGVRRFHPDILADLQELAWGAEAS